MRLVTRFFVETNNVFGRPSKGTLSNELDGGTGWTQLEADGPVQIPGLVLCDSAFPGIFYFPSLGSTELLFYEVKLLS